MISPGTILLLTLALLAASIGGVRSEITSENHAVLQRALTQVPAADADRNGVLSLDEYRALPANPRRKAPKDSGPPPFLPVLPNGDVVIHEFEDNTFREADGWTPAGAAFARTLQLGSLKMTKRVGRYQGELVLTTITGTDTETGSLRSPEFLVEQDYLLVTMSGGRFPLRVCVNLLLDDEVVRSVTGRNDDALEETTFDLREFRGQIAQVELRDDSRDFWGHLNVDRIVMSDQAGSGPVISEKPAPAPDGAGFALTTNGTIPGPFHAGHEALVVAAPPPGVPGVTSTYVPSDQLLLVINQRKLPASDQRHGAVRLLSGESWQVEIGELTEGILAIKSPLTGARTIPLDKIASLEFEAGNPTDRREPGHLYRSNGEPIPGKLVWVRAKDIAIDCPLGVVPIPRELVQRFVFAAAPDSTNRTADEVGLVDGSLLFGTISLTADHLILNHELLGKITIGWEAVRFLRRSRPGVTWLDHLPWTVVERIGPVLPPPAPEVLPGDDDTHLHALRIHPTTTLRFPHEAGDGHSARLVARLAPVPGARADVTVTIRDGEAVRWRETIPATSGPIALPESLLITGDLSIEVAFAGPLVFPAGIELRDPCLVSIPTPATPPQPKPQD